MAILAFQKPDKVILLESDDKFGRFEFRPLEPGYGITVGNALRRILLSSLEGYAITSMKIEGVDHEFSTIPGVIDDVTDVILNLKKTRFKKLSDEVDGEKFTVNISGSDAFKAGDLNQFMTGFKVLNPELVIARMNPEANLHITLTIQKGRGYVPADENRQVESEIGVIAIDSIFTPMRNVKYSVENYRVEQKNRLREVDYRDFDRRVNPSKRCVEGSR